MDKDQTIAEMKAHIQEADELLMEGEGIMDNLCNQLIEARANARFWGIMSVVGMFSTAALLVKDFLQ